MSITTAELIAYGSTSRPINDTTTTGGAIDTTNQPVFTQLGSSSTLEVLSSSGSDTSQTVTVTGRDASGVYQTSTATLSGTSPQALSPATTFERVLTCTLSGVAVGTITLRKSGAGATVGTIAPSGLSFSAMFINSFSAGTTQTRYEKLFLANTDATLTLTSATVTLTADPVGGVFTAGVAASLNDSVTIANRTNAPAGIVFYDR